MATYIFELYCPWTHKAWYKRRLIKAPNDIKKVIEVVSKIADNKYPFIIYDNKYKELYKSTCKDM